MASVSDLQEQGLSFFSKHEHSILLPQQSLSLIVSEQSNSPTWLVSGVIQQSLSSDNECFLSPHSPSRQKPALPTFLFSFSNTELTYSKYFHKYITKNKDIFKFKSFITDDTQSLETWNSIILEDVKKIASYKGLSPVVIIENPELLLSVVPGMVLSKLLSQLMAIQQQCALYIVTSSSTTIAPQFLPSLLQRASLLVSLTPLSTGRADDISGVLSISPGPIRLDEETDNTTPVADRQYSYLVSTNAVKLYYK